MSKLVKTRHVVLAAAACMVLAAVAGCSNGSGASVAAKSAAYTVHNPDGELIQSVVAGGALDAPWGIAMAPNDFGAFSNALLIGNFGDGTINGYDPVSGSYVGTLSRADGTPIAIPGLWGIDFGNGVDSQPTNGLFFAAGSNHEADGVYGRIDTATPDAAPMGIP